MHYDKIHVDGELTLKDFLDKLRSIPSEVDVVMVIIHSQSSAFKSQVNIELIKKQAQRWGKELVFITRIKEIKALLSSTGGEVYSRVEEWEEKIGEASFSHQQKYNSLDSKSNKYLGLKSKVFFLFFFLALAGALWFYFLFPQVTVHIEPVQEERIITTEIEAVSGLDEISYEQASLPLISREYRISEEFEVPVINEKEVGVSRAKGEVLLLNNQEREIRVPKGTVVRSNNGLEFATVEEAVVPSARVERLMDKIIEREAGRKEVRVEALERGSEANVEAGAVVEWRSNNSYPLEVINPEGFRGGEDEKVKLADEEELAQARNQVKEKLLEKGSQMLKERSEEGEVFFEETNNLEVKEVISHTESGTQTEKMKVEGEFLASIFGLEKEGLKDLVFKLYKREIGNDFRLQSPQIAIKDVDILNKSKESLVMKVRSKGQIVAEVDKEKLSQKIAGKQVSAAEQVLEQLSEVDDYRITPTNQVNLPQFKLGLNLVIAEMIDEE